MSQISNKFHKYTCCIYVCWGDMYRKSKRLNTNCWLNFTRSEISVKPCFTEEVVQYTKYALLTKLKRLI